MSLSDLNDHKRLRGGDRKGDTQERRYERDEFTWSDSPVPLDGRPESVSGEPGSDQEYAGRAIQSQRDELREQSRLRRRVSFSQPYDGTRGYHTNKHGGIYHQDHIPIRPRPAHRMQQNQVRFESDVATPRELSQDLNIGLAASVPQRRKHNARPPTIHFEATYDDQMDHPTSARASQLPRVPPPIPLTAENLTSAQSVANRSTQDSSSSRGSRDTQDSWRVRPASPSTSIDDIDDMTILVKGNATLNIGDSVVSVRDGAEIRIRSGDVKNYGNTDPSPSTLYEERQPNTNPSAMRRRSGANLSRDMAAKSPDHQAQDKSQSSTSHRRIIDSQATSIGSRPHSTGDGSKRLHTRAAASSDDSHMAKGSRQMYVEDCDEDGNVINDTRTYTSKPKRRNSGSGEDGVSIPNTSRPRGEKSVRFLIKKTDESTSRAVARTNKESEHESKNIGQTRRNRPIQIFQTPPLAQNNRPQYDVRLHLPTNTIPAVPRARSPANQRPWSYYGPYANSLIPQPVVSVTNHPQQIHSPLSPAYPLMPYGPHNPSSQMRQNQVASGARYIQYPYLPPIYSSGYPSPDYFTEYNRVPARPTQNHYQTGSRDDSAVPRRLTDTLYGSDKTKTLRRRPSQSEEVIQSHDIQEDRVPMPPAKPRKVDSISAASVKQTTYQDLTDSKTLEEPISSTKVDENTKSERNSALEKEDLNANAEEPFKSQPDLTHDEVKAEETGPPARAPAASRASLLYPLKIREQLAGLIDASSDTSPPAQRSQIILPDDAQEVLQPTDSPHPARGSSSPSAEFYYILKEVLECSTLDISGQMSEGQQHIGAPRHESSQNPVKRTSHQEVSVNEGGDTISLQSYSESIINSVFDTTSSRSTASSVPSDVQALVGAFVDLLVRDESIDRMLERILSEPGAGIGTERFRRNFSRILRSYARELKRSLSDATTEPREAGQAHAAAFISRKTTHASNLVVARYTGQMKQPGTIRSDNASLVSRYLDQVIDFDSDENTDPEDAQQVFAIDRLELFLTAGQPFRRLKWNLRALILPDSFLELVRTSATKIIGLVLADKDLAPLLVELERQCRMQETPCSTLLAGRIRDLGLALKNECSTRSHYDAAAFLSVYSEYIAVRFLEVIGVSEAQDMSSHTFDDPPSGNVVSGGDSFCEAALYGNSQLERITPEPLQENGARAEKIPTSTDENYCRRPSPEDILEDIVANRLPTVCEADFSTNWRFIASSKAFTDFLRSLHAEAYPTFFTKARENIMETIRSAGVDNEELQAEGRRLLPILTEIQWCVESRREGADLQFMVGQDFEANLTVSDRMKLAVEASTGSHWNWWPLRPPSRPPQAPKIDSDVVISWTCNCGALRQEKIATPYSSLLQMLHKHYPLTSPISWSSGTPPLPQRPTSSLSSNSSQASSHDSISDTSSVEGHDAGQLSAASTVVTIPSANASVVSLTDDQRLFVFLLVLVASRFRFVSMEVTKMTSQAFFRALAEKYRERRGRVRQLFSIFVYSHCDFVKARRFAPQRFGPGTKFSYPPCEDTEYKFAPRPMEEAPITRHMFYELFHACYDEDTLAHRLHSSVSLTGCDGVLSALPEELIDYLPKRNCDVPTDAQFDKVEIFWGLVAREQRSALRVAVYTLLSLLPSVWFGFQWMFGWGHPGDLQDATVPFMMTCTIWGMLWAAVYSGSDVKEI